MERVNRVDRGRLGAKKRTPQGYLRVDGWPTRVGIFEYRNPDGSIRRELRLPEEVFKADSLATLGGVPITDDHPPEMLDTQNTRIYQRGTAGPMAVRDGDRIRVDGMTITDAELIAKVEAGKVELSSGYACDLDVTGGTHPEWGRYDVIQRNITHNHLAVVDRGRAGPEARLRLDAAEQLDGEPAPTPPPTEEPKTMKIKIRGVEFDIPDQAAQALELERNDHAAALDTQKDTAKAEKERADKAQARVDSLEDEAKQRKDAGDQLPAMLKARRELERKAEKHLPAETVAKLDSMPDQDIKVACIKAIQPTANLDGKDAAYIDARFDAALELAADRTDSTGDLANKLQAGQRNADAADDNDPDKARQKMVEAQRARCK